MTKTLVIRPRSRVGVRQDYLVSMAEKLGLTVSVRVSHGGTREFYSISKKQFLASGQTRQEVLIDKVSLDEAQMWLRGYTACTIEQGR